MLCRREEEKAALQVLCLLLAVLVLSFIALLYFRSFEKAALKGRSLLLALLVLTLLALLWEKAALQVRFTSALQVLY